jgi:hypothetical protein
MSGCRCAGHSPENTRTIKVQYPYYPKCLAQVAAGVIDPEYGVAGAA